MTQDTGDRVGVSGYDESKGTNNTASIVTAAVAYDCPNTHQTYVLFFHQALYIPQMTTHLVSPFQLREQGIVIRDTPLSHIPSENRSSEAHSLSCAEKNLFIPMDLNGTMSGFLTRKPTWLEVNELYS